MKDLKTESTSDLVMRMNEINREIDILHIEYNQIVKELWDRIPGVRDHEDMQMKIRVKKKGEDE